MFAISIGVCPNCGHHTHMECGSIGRQHTDACPSCLYLFSEDGQVSSALVGRVAEWQGIKRFYGVETFAELREAIKKAAEEHGFEDGQAWSFNKDEDNTGYCKLGGLKASATYGIERLKYLEEAQRYWR